MSTLLSNFLNSCINTTSNKHTAENSKQQQSKTHIATTKISIT